MWTDKNQGQKMQQKQTKNAKSLIKQMKREYKIYGNK